MFLDGKSSQESSVNAGVSQGHILGSPLLILFNSGVVDVKMDGFAPHGHFQNVGILVGLRFLHCFYCWSCPQENGSYDSLWISIWRLLYIFRNPPWNIIISSGLVFLIYTCIWLMNYWNKYVGLLVLQLLFILNLWVSCLQFSELKPFLWALCWQIFIWAG